MQEVVRACAHILVVNKNKCVVNDVDLAIYSIVYGFGMVS